MTISRNTSGLEDTPRSHSPISAGTLALAISQAKTLAVPMISITAAESEAERRISRGRSENVSSR